MTCIGSMSSRSINFHEDGLVVKFSGKIFLLPPASSLKPENFLASSFSSIILFHSYPKYAVLQNPSFLWRSPIRLPIFSIPRVSLNLGLSDVLLNTLKLTLKRRRKKYVPTCNIFQFHIMADFRLPTWSHWTLIWEEMCIVGFSQISSSKPLPALYMAVKTEAQFIVLAYPLKDTWVYAYLPVFPFLPCFNHLSILCQPHNRFQNKKKDYFVFFLF